MKLLTMAALYILDKLAEIANSSRLQDKIKVIFIHARGVDESFIALMRDLCSALRRAEALKPLDYMKEMVVRDSATLRVLEQLLAGTVGPALDRSSSMLRNDLTGIILPVLTILLSLPVGTTLPAGTVYSTSRNYTTSRNCLLYQ
ncbi:hypothetical protein Tco_1346051 [Tanacetum coccineum]